MPRELLNSPSPERVDHHSYERQGVNREPGHPHRAVEGRLDEALTEMRLAKRTDPFSPKIQLTSAAC
jgi:hypothetical protein